tara:strand:+ start:147 stop:485 length:339 start_codon:yes stop_codon:yes gene_type:complete
MTSRKLINLTLTENEVPTAIILWSAMALFYTGAVAGLAAASYSTNPSAFLGVALLLLALTVASLTASVVWHWDRISNRRERLVGILESYTAMARDMGQAEAEAASTSTTEGR